MTKGRTADEEAYGDGAIVYCASHLRPHSVGWCTVPLSEKILLEARDHASAVEECKARGLKIYSHE